MEISKRLFVFIENTIIFLNGRGLSVEMFFPFMSGRSFVHVVYVYIDSGMMLFFSTSTVQAARKIVKMKL